MATNNTSESWEEFLNPEVLRGKLISASLYLAAFEMLKGSIVNRIRDFYTFHFDEAGGHPDPKYDQEVLSRNRSTVYASISWLIERNAIDQSDVETFERLKDCRNRIAHEMAQLALPGGTFDHLTLFPDLVALLRKVETWWIVNVEIPTNEDFDGMEIDEAGIIPGPIMTVRMMLDIALGSEAEATAYLSAFRERRQGPASEKGPT
jgi:hypothetical protein